MNNLNAVALTIAPVESEDGDFILIGFNSAVFSQAVNLPYSDVDSARQFADQIHEAIVKSAEQIRAKRLIVE